MRLFSQDKKIEALKHAPLFDGLARKDLVALSRLAEDLEVPPGTVLCREGETGKEFFVIIDGTVDVEADGKRLASLGPGDCVGEIALLERVPRMATVTATSPLRFFVLTRDSFQRLVRDNPAVERKILRALALRLLELSRDPTLA